MRGNEEHGLKVYAALCFLADGFQGSFKIIVFFFIEISVFFFCNLGVGLLPERNHAVESLVLCYLFILVLWAFFKLLVFGKHTDRISYIVAVFLDKHAKLVFLKKFTVLFVVGICLDIKCYNSTFLCLFARGDSVAVSALRLPDKRFLSAVSAALDGYFVRNHKSGVEADTKLSYYIYFFLILVFGIVLEVKGAALCDNS